jgi:hypothetical protein
MASMPAATTGTRSSSPVFQMTLLQLVTLLLDITDSEEHAVEMAFDLVVAGEVILTGNFRETHPGHWH